MNLDTNKFIIISKILNGADKTVSLINEVKPIYNDIKPLIVKGSNILNKKNKPTNFVSHHSSAVIGNNPKFFV